MIADATETRMGRGMSFGLGLVVYIMGFALDQTLKQIIGSSIPFIEFILAIVLYFAVIRPHKGSGAFYLLGFLLPVILIVLGILSLVALLGGL